MSLIIPIAFRSKKSVVSFTGPLDSAISNLSIATSVTKRLLSSWTSSIFRVRRSSDNAEMDIGYTSLGLADTATLLSFVGAGSGYIVKLYDQSGNGRDFIQSTASAQPRIVNAGVLEDGMNFNASYYMDIASDSYTSYTDGSNIQIVVDANCANTNNRLFDFGPDQIASWYPYLGSIYWDAAYAPGRISVAIPGGFATAFAVASFERAGTTSTIRYNGTSLLTTGISGTISGTSIFRLGASDGGLGITTGSVRTFVLWKDCVNPSTRAALIR